jgi:hypothetical protein
LSSQAAEPVKVEDTADIDMVVTQFKQVIIQSAVDLACRQQAMASAFTLSLHSTWEEIKAQVVDMGEQDTYTVPAPKKLKTDYEFKVTQLMAAYADVIKNLFNSRQDTPMRMSLVQEFAHVDNTCVEYDRESFELIWSLLGAQLAGLSDEMEMDEEVATLLENTCKFLELSYTDKVSQVVRRTSRRLPVEQVKEFCHSELSSIVSKDHADIQDLEYDSVGEAPWAILFYLMRSGRYDAASEYARANAITQPIAIYVKTYYQGRGVLSFDHLARLVEDLTALETTDIYHRAVLAILTRYNIELDELQSGSLEDYLWIKLKLVNTHLNPVASQDLPNYQFMTFPELRSSFSNSDPSAFKGKPMLYTFALVAALCYGEAIQFLHSHDKELEAVHLAVALKEHNLLPYMDSQTVVFESVREVMHVNYDELLRKYVRHLEYPMPNAALAYIGLMQNDQAVVIAASDVVISTQNYQIILNDEVYILSSIFRQKVGVQLYNDVVKRVAHFAADQQSSEAVRLFDLIDEKAAVMELIIKQEQTEIRRLWSLWREHRTVLDVRPPSAQPTSRSFIQEKYVEIFNKYQSASSQMQVYTRALSGLDILYTFYSCLQDRHYESSVGMVLSSWLMPIRTPQLASGISEAVKRAHSAVKEELPDAIVTAISVLEQLSRQATDYPADLVRQELKALTSYFNELEGSLRDLPLALQRWKELSKQVMEVKSQLF